MSTEKPEGKGWKRIKYADECTPCSICGEPFCEECSAHYADCRCIGPGQLDDEEIEFSDCEEWARYREDA